MQERVREALGKTPHPRNAADFQAAPSLPCLNQSNTLICWSFATCSFLESEMARLKLPSVRLSVMYPAYCQYIEKARRFVQTKGESRFSPGDTFCGVPDACRQYGAMPASVYDEVILGQSVQPTPALRRSWRAACRRSSCVASGTSLASFPRSRRS